MVSFTWVAVISLRWLGEGYWFDWFVGCDTSLEVLGLVMVRSTIACMGFIRRFAVVVASRQSCCCGNHSHYSVAE